MGTRDDKPKDGRSSADMAAALKKLEEEIAERRHAEELLRSSEERYRQLVENATDVIYETDAAGHVRYLNPSAEKLSGYSTKEIIGRNYLDFLPPAYHDEQSRLLGIQFVKKIPTSYHETPVLTKDGREVWLWQSVNLIIENDEVTGFRVIARDITDRKRTEEALRESEERWKFALEGAGDGVWDWNAQTGKVFYSRQWKAILGFADDEIGDALNEWEERVHPDDQAHVQAEINKHLEGKTPIYISEHRVRCKDGSFKWILDRGKVISRTPEGRPLRVIGTHADITERKRSETERMELDRRLQQAQKLESLGILAGGIAHDFNNLLMGVLGNLDLALLEMPRDSRARTLVEKAGQAGRRAADLTRQMLAYSGKGRYIVGRVDLNGLVRESENLIRAAIPRSVSLDISLTSSGNVIEADGDQVKQVIMNLVTNAAEAMKGNPGRIVLRTGVEHCDEKRLSRSRLNEKPPAGRFVFVEVADTGCGMDEETRQRIFEPFFTTKFTGRGLGMSAVLGIMGNHSGAIFIDSEAGRGSTISVMFPAAEAGVYHAGMDVPAEESQHAVDVQPGSILVVDDEEQVREVCSVFVEHLGFEPITASDGSEAVELFRKHADRIACVLLDLTMPRLDGISAFKEMRAVRDDIPVVLSSGYSEQDISRRFSSLGLAGFIQKPYTLHELKDKIDHAMKRSMGRGGR